MKRKLTDEVLADIKIDRETYGMSLSQICEKYNLGKSCAFSAIKDMDDSQVKISSPSRRIIAPLSLEERRSSRPDISKGDLGEAARQAVIAQLMLRGFVIFQPISEDTPIDFLIYQKNRILKCQCKCMFLTENGSHHMNLSSIRPNKGLGKAVHHRYTKDEVDFFFGYVLDDSSIYVFPFDSLSGMKRVVSVWVNRQPLTKKEREVDPSKFRNAFDLLLE